VPPWRRRAFALTFGRFAGFVEARRRALDFRLFALEALAFRGVARRFGAADLLRGAAFLAALPRFRARVLRAGFLAMGFSLTERP